MSDKKKVTDLRSNIRKRMGEPPSQSFLNDMLDTAPLKSSMLRLNLDDIQRYERNPRWIPNPEHEDIKISIRERGLDQPLIVTLRPGDRHYTLKKGGGTRYQILRELYEETGEKRFYELEVVVEPYRDELDLIIGHGIENLKRGQMAFIETAKFFIDLKQLHEEIEGRELSTREACELINRDGFSVQQARLVQYNYALRLYQYIPQTLEAGAGRPVIEKIRRHEKASLSIWQHFSDDLALFEQLWGDALASNDDGPAFDVQSVQAAFENAAGAVLEISPQVLSGMVDLALQEPDRTAMSQLSSGPGGSTVPAYARPPSPPPAFAEELEAPEEQGLDDEDDERQAPLAPPPRPTAPTSAAPRAATSPAPTATGTTPPRTPPVSRHGPLSLLPPHIGTDKGPPGGFEYLRHQMEQLLAGWVSPRDQEPLYRAAKPVAAWANVLLNYFNVPPEPEAGDPPNQRFYVRLGVRQLHLRAPQHNLSGNHVFDHAWLRIAQIFYGPSLLERDDDAMKEYTMLLKQCCRRVLQQADGLVEMPDLLLPQMIYLHTLSRLVLADPAHAWLDQALHSLQTAADEFLIVRRQQADLEINPLGLLPDPHTKP